jgi:membrane-associated two-gene conflict system component 1 (EACC1)
LQPTGMNENDKGAVQCIQLGVRLRQHADEPGELAEICAALRGAGADRAERPTFGQPIPGRRGAEQIAADVVATLGGSAIVLERVLGALRKWLAGRPRRSIEVTIGDASITMTGLSSVNEDRIVDAFIRQVCPEK